MKRWRRRRRATFPEPNAILPDGQRVYITGDPIAIDIPTVDRAPPIVYRAALYRDGKLRPVRADGIRWLDWRRAAVARLPVLARLLAGAIR